MFIRCFLLFIRILGPDLRRTRSTLVEYELRLDDLVDVLECGVFLDAEVEFNLAFVVLGDLDLEVFELYLLVVPDPPHLVQVSYQVILLAKECSLVLEVPWLSLAGRAFEYHRVAIEEIPRSWSHIL